MEENCETSIIDYLAQEFTNSILANPTYIKDIIINRIKEMMNAPHNKIFKKGNDEILPEIKSSKQLVKSPTKRTKRVIPLVETKGEEVNDTQNKNKE